MATILHSVASMLLTPILLLYSALSHTLNLPTFTAPDGGWSHKVCLSLAPMESQWRFIYSALVCGAKLPKGDIHGVLRTVGLIHLVVVSGAHLMFLEQLVRRALTPLGLYRSWVTIPLLCIYALVCQAHPPIIRALVGMATAQASSRFKLFWTRPQVILLTGATCLAVFPNWWQSLSLQISWAASLALSFRSKNGFKKHLNIYLLLLPIFLSLQPLHPASIFCNWLIAPVIAHLLFPLTFVAHFFHPLSQIVDPMWTFILTALSVASDYMQVNANNLIQTPHWARWLYIASLHLFLHLKTVGSARKCHGS